MNKFFIRHNTILFVEKKSLNPFGLFFSIFSLVVFMCSSCVDYKKISYFSDISDTTSSMAIKLPEYANPVIKNYDLLYISIQTLDPEMTKLLNQRDYIVDSNGEVELPLIKKIKISDLTIYEARDAIKKTAEKLLNAATVDVRFANFQVTVLGEVNKPSNIVVSDQKITILEALGLAGDLTIYGKRENVLLIRQRENDSSEIAVRLNLNSKSLFASPYFYLKPRDVIYVQPNKSKVLSTDLMQPKYITLASSLVSLIIVLLTRII